MKLSVQNGFLVEQIDFWTTYLNANIDSDAYVKQPEGFVGNEREAEMVFKLKKSLYDLKQSGWNWNSLVHNFLLRHDFQQSIANYCVNLTHEETSTSKIIIWIDDSLIATSN